MERSQRFCNRCGAEVGSRVDPAEQEPAPAPAAPATPDHLEQKIVEGAAQMEGERKQVTAVFADVVGSMDLAERLDPERWREMMDRLFKLLADSVHEFEGTVDKFTGDGIMALFGAPVAHEDHARRACHAALAMREAARDYSAELRGEGIPLGIRIGINSGEVVFGSIGADRVEYTAVGHTVGLAQRMESAASTGSAYLTARTAALVEGFFELAPVGALEVKGSSEAIEAYELLGIGAAHGGLEVARARGLSRFVGREAELADLEAILDRTSRGGGEVVGIVADAGIGKSRLCDEFLAQCRERGMRIFSARCHAHMREIPLVPVLEMMRDRFGITPEDADQRARERIEAELEAIDLDLGEELGMLFELLGIADPERPGPEMNPEARNLRLRDLVRRLVQATNREASVSMVEDLQWIDPASAAFLEVLVDALPAAGGLLLTSFRPGYHADWMGRSHYHQVPLQPLGDSSLGALIEELLGDDPSLDGLGEMIVGRTGGNPFYAEEVIRELAEAGALEGGRGAYRLVHEIGELAVPATVQAVLAARIDRLRPEAKSALQCAAAIGFDFSERLLAAASGLGPEGVESALSELVEGEFVHATSLYPVPEYSFRHQLTREVARGSQLAADRERVHAALARALQETEPDRIDENAALIAQHFEAAGEPMEAARWHARAAGWTGFGDPAAAHRHWQRIRELDPQLPDDPEADSLRGAARLMLVGTGWRLGIDIETQREIFEEGRALAERSGDQASLALLHSGLGIATGTSAGDVEEFVRLALESKRIADRSGDPALIAVTGANGYPLFLTGRFEEALEMCDAVIELTADDHGLGAGVVIASPRAWSLSFRSMPLQVLGRYAEARAALEEGAAFARRTDEELLGWTHMFACAHRWWGGDMSDEQLADHARGTLEIGERLGDAFSRSFAIFWSSWARFAAGDLDAARAGIERALALIAERGITLEGEPFMRGELGLVLASSGDLERAVREGERAVALADERGTLAYSPPSRLALAATLLDRGAPGDADRVGKLVAESEEVARRLGMRPITVRALGLRARLSALAGDETARERALSEGIGLARELGSERLVAELETAGEAARTAGL